MGADEVEGADRTSASAAQAVRERVEAVPASISRRPSVATTP